MENDVDLCLNVVYVKRIYARRCRRSCASSWYMNVEK